MPYKLAAAVLIGLAAATGTPGQNNTPAPTSPDDRYVLGPDSEPQAGVPEGKVIELKLPASKVFSGYEHETWLYIPSQYNGKKPIALMAFQDGVATFLPRNGAFRAAVVLNNLIAKGELPVMAAVFVNPGAAKKFAGDGSPLGGDSNRSYEYDTVNDEYARFLIEEVLPEVRKQVKITDNPEGRGIAGYSSGGICAFKSAWFHPDQFRKVFSNNGSFVNIRGGNVMPELVRGADRKPLRVFLQDGKLDALGGPFEGLDWPAGNKAMAAALSEKGYDYQFVLGEGTHSPKHAAAIFPDALRWLWRDYRPK